MSFDVPESSLTPEELARIANFRRELADALDAALSEGGGIVETDDIADAAVTMAKLEPSPGARVLGTTEAGAPTYLTGSQVTGLLDPASTAAPGLLPRLSGDTTKYLRGDGEYAVPPAGAWMPHIDARDYGADPTGTADSSAAIRNALAAAAALGGGYVLLPPKSDGTEGVYLVSRQGSNSWCINLPACDRLVIQGVRGLSRLKMVSNAATGLPAETPVALLRCTDNTNLTIRELTFDGNWGNPVTKVGAPSEGLTLPQSTITVESTAPDGYAFPSSGTVYIRTTAGLQAVTYTGKTATTLTGCSGGTGALQRGQDVGWVDSQAGQNQVTQVDPKNYLLWLYQGCKSVVVEHCTFVQAYGDGVWIGGTASSGIEGVTLRDCDVRVAARNGVTLSVNARNVRVINTHVHAPYTTAFDTEPAVVGTEDVVARDSSFRLWWGDSGTVKSSVSIDGGSTLGPGVRSAAKRYTLENCYIEGAVVLSDSRTVHIDKCTFRNTRSLAWPSIIAYGGNDDLWITNNTIYDKAFSNSPYTGAITITEYAGGAAVAQPAGVKIYGNKIKARNNRDGIVLRGIGGTAGDSGVATGVTSTTLTDTAKAWPTDQYAGHYVRVGGAQASITANNGTTLTLSASGWTDEWGNVMPTPPPGAYTIYPTSGMVDVAGNTIELVDDDGAGAGQFGVFVTTPYAGARVRLRGNTVRGGATRGIRIVPSVSSSNAFKLLEITDNHVYDDQATPTCAQGVSFSTPTNIGKLVLRNNTISGGTTTTVNGLTSGTWLIDESKISTWGGYGSPEGVVTAPIGSIYLRADGAAGTTFYVKESGTGNTGWVAK